MATRYYIVSSKNLFYDALKTEDSKYIGTNKIVAIQCADDGDHIYSVDVVCRETVTVEKSLGGGVIL